VPLGYCEACSELTRIVPLACKPLSRERRWYPQPHTKADGTKCNGHTSEIQNHPEYLPPFPTR
jgi:hypothetical protein